MKNTNSDTRVGSVSPKESKTIKIMVVDDHEVVREGLDTVLRTESDIELVSQAASCPECLKELERLQPDIILMDIKMPIGDSFGTVRRIRELYPRIAIIILTGFGTRLYVSEALELGVRGFVTKNCSKRLMCNAIRTVMDGGSVWEGDIVHDAVQSIRHRSKIQLKPTRYFSNDPKNEIKLSPRESEIVKLITTGQTNKGIALILGVSDQTVKKSVMRIMKKLNVANRTQIAVASLNLKLE